MSHHHAVRQIACRVGVIILLTGVVAAPVAAQRRAAPGSARAVAQRTLSALAAQNAEGFAREASPQDLAAFRSQLLPKLQTAMAGKQRPQVLAMFPPATSYEELQKIPAERLFALYLGAVMKRVGSAGSLHIENTILGEVPEGDSLVHVVYRQRVKSSESAANNVTVLSLRRTPGGWKVVLEAGQYGMESPQAGTPR